MPFQAGFYYGLHEGGSADQKPVILIHGAGSSHLFWPAEIRRLAGHTVIALDLPGHGRSNGIGCQSIRDYCAAVVEFLANAGIFKAAFIGHSMGGAVALQLALDYPQHVIGIGAIATGTNFTLPGALIAYLSSSSTAAAGREILAERFVRAGAQQKSSTADEVLTMLSTRPGVLYGDWLACSRFDLHRQLPQINVPAFIAGGYEDKLTQIAPVQALVSGLPIARLEMFHDAGHLLPLEKPAALAVSLKRFLDDLMAWHAHYPLRVAFPDRLDGAPRPKKDSQDK